MTLVTCLLTVVMMNVVMIQGTSRLCEVHCRDPATRDYPNAIPGCNCSHQFNKSISESVRIKSLAPDKTEISDDVPTGKLVSKLDSPQIYYIVNPKKVNIKITNNQPLERSISETNVRSIKHDQHGSDENPLNKMEVVQQDRPLYLDIGMQSDSKSEKAKDFELTEDSLSDCLDLNILIYCRKSKSSTTTEKVLNRDLIKKYENLSDSELILAIKTKCSRPSDVVNKSLNDVRDRRPKKENRNKTIVPSIGGNEEAVLTPIYVYATPRLTNRRDHKEENEEEKEATEYSEVSNLALDISKPIIDTPEEHSNTEQSNEYRNAEPAIINKFDDFSSYQYPYSTENHYGIENIGSNVETSTKTIKINEHDILPGPLLPNNSNKDLSPDDNVNYAENYNRIIPLWKIGETKDTSDETPRKYHSNENRNANPAIKNNADDVSSYQYPYRAETSYDIKNIGSNVEISTKAIKKNDVTGSLPPSYYNKESSPDDNVNYAENFDTIIPLWKTGETEDTSNETLRKDQSNENRETEKPETKTQFDKESFNQISNSKTKNITESSSNSHAEEAETNTKFDYESSNQFPHIRTKDIPNEFYLKDQSNENRNAEEAETDKNMDYDSSNQFPYIGMKDNESRLKYQSNENRNAEEAETDTKLDYESSNQYPYGEILMAKEDTHSRSDSKKVHKVDEITEHDINSSPTECVLYTDHEHNRNNGKEEGIAQTNNDVAISNENVTESRLGREYLGSNQTSTKNINITEAEDGHRSNNIELSPNIYQTKTEDAAGRALRNISMKSTVSNLNKSEETHAFTSITTSRNLEFVDLTTDDPSTTAYSSTKPPNFLSTISLDDFTGSVLNSAISQNTTNPQNGGGTFPDHTKSVNESNNSGAEKDNPSIIKEPRYNASNSSLVNSTLFDFSTNSTYFTDDLANNFNISKVQSEENSVEQYHEYSKSVTNTHSNHSKENTTQTAKQIESTNTETERHTLYDTEDFLRQRNSEESSQIPISNTETTPRLQYSEQEIKIPKIITAELQNGTVDSRTDGYEVPPTHDFVSDENIDSTEVNLNTTKLNPKSEIFGHIYLVFNKFAVPAKFTQDPRGNIRLGLDGFSLCQHWLTDNHQSEFFAKLCKSQKQQPLD